MADILNTKDKVQNPQAHFEEPTEIIHDEALSQEEKKKALHTWEQDEQQLLTASNEGMPGSDEGLRLDDNNRLDEVIKTEEQIGEKPSQKLSH